MIIISTSVSAQSSAVASSRESSVLALATTDITVSPHTSNGEILAILDSGTSKHILQCRTLLANAKEAHSCDGNPWGIQACARGDRGGA